MGRVDALVKTTIRFPDDFMFELIAEEYDSLRCQNSISKEGKGEGVTNHSFLQKVILQCFLVYRNQKGQC